MMDQRPKHQNDMELQHLQYTSPALCINTAMSDALEIKRNDDMQHHKHSGVLHYIMGI
jgi:hypothetical protein